MSWLQSYSYFSPPAVPASSSATLLKLVFYSPAHIKKKASIFYFRRGLFLDYMITTEIEQEKKHYPCENPPSHLKPDKLDFSYLATVDGQERKWIPYVVK